MSVAQFPINNYLLLGLVNGAQGTVVGIIYREGCSPPSPPDLVLVKFDNYIGMLDNVFVFADPH